MESLNLKTYLLYAIYIVRTQKLILYFICIVGILNGFTVYFPESGFSNFVGSFTLLSAFIISPIIYGIYYEVVEKKQNLLADIFRTYVPGYLLVVISMSIPISIITLFILSAIGKPDPNFFMLGILLLSLPFIYVIPTFYVSGKIIDSITFGLRFFFKNFFASAPVLLMALLSELLLLIPHFGLTSLKEFSPSLYVVADLFIYLVASILDFLLFIMLLYVIKSQDIEKRK